jgi:hypothetical protein
MEFLKKHWMTLAVVILIAYVVNKRLNKEVEQAEKLIKD